MYECVMFTYRLSVISRAFNMGNKMGATSLFLTHNACENQPKVMVTDVGLPRKPILKKSNYQFSQLRT